MYLQQDVQSKNKHIFPAIESLTVLAFRTNQTGLRSRGTPTLPLSRFGIRMLQFEVKIKLSGNVRQIINYLNLKRLTCNVLMHPLAVFCSNNDILTVLI